MDRRGCTDYVLYRCWIWHTYSVRQSQQVQQQLLRVGDFFPQKRSKNMCLLHTYEILLCNFWALSLDVWYTVVTVYRRFSIYSEDKCYEKCYSNCLM